MEIKMEYRLGLDMGANSIGWCVAELGQDSKPVKIACMGVRVFPDGRNPKDGSSLASKRRLYRQSRRMRDRYIQRRESLMKILIRHGLMSEDESRRKALQELDPYFLRARGLDEVLPLEHVGRAIFQLNQRRGFKSNRKTDQGDGESGKIRSGVENLKRAMTDVGARTYGEFLYLRHQRREPVRARLKGQGAKATYEFYPDRALLEEEFNMLWEAQAAFHSEMTKTAREEIEGVLFFQRPLKPVEPGVCTLIPTDKRAPWALPLTQHFRILQELGNLTVFDADLAQRPLDRDERDLLLAKLLGQKTVTFDSMRKILQLDKGCMFNLEGEKRKNLKGDETAAVLAHKDRFGKRWRSFSLQEQNQIVEKLLETENEKAMEDWLIEKYGVDRDLAQRIAEAPLPQGYSRLGRTAMGRIVEVMQHDALPYFAAAKAVGLHHSDLRTGEVFDELPYYGDPLMRHVLPVEQGSDEEVKYGRIANPTVHIGLNQLRKIVNEMIRTWGKPKQIVLEVARELKLSRERRREIEEEQSRNQKANESRRKKLETLGLSATTENLLRLRLWEELNDNPVERRCIYTGENISLERLFSSSVEIEHILPFSRTLDNSTANKTVSLRYANRYKERLSPFEAFGDSPDGYDWEGILARAAGLPKNKLWRFSPEAMDRFEGEKDFLARHLTDTQYLSRAAREYLTCVCDNVWVTPGKLTSMLRGKWGLNKNRNDQRHHAMDAAVITVTDRGLLQKISRAAARSEEEGAHRALKEMPEPWEGFRADVECTFAKIIVSYRPDHSTLSGLHNDTAYGPGKDQDGNPVAVHRIPLESITKAKDALQIRSRVLQKEILDMIATAADTAELKKRLRDFSKKTGVRRVRVQEKLETIPIRDAKGEIYKGVKGDANVYVEIYKQRDGNWNQEVVSTFDANQKGFMTGRQRQSLPLVMRLFKNDLVAVGNGVERRILRVVKFSSAGRIFLAEHNEGGKLKSRNEDNTDPFKYYNWTARHFQTNGVRKVSVDILGRVKDPGAKP